MSSVRFLVCEDLASVSWCSERLKFAGVGEKTLNSMGLSIVTLIVESRDRKLNSKY